MKKLIISLFIALAACSHSQTEQIVLEEPIFEASPVLPAPVVGPGCPTDEAIAHDGIGGTGCR